MVLEVAVISLCNSGESSTDQLRGFCAAAPLACGRKELEWRLSSWSKMWKTTASTLLQDLGLSLFELGSQENYAVLFFLYEVLGSGASCLRRSGPASSWALTHYKLPVRNLGSRSPGNHSDVESPKLPTMCTQVPLTQGSPPRAM